MTPQPVRVVHLHKIAGVSGSENHLVHLLGHLDRRRFEPTLVMLAPGRAPSPDRQYVDRLLAADVRVEVMRIRADVDPLLVSTLTAWLRKERPAIVHTHLIHADLHGTIAARLAGVPVVISTKHNDDPFRLRAPVRALERWLARRTDRVIAISDWIRRFTIEAVATPPDKVITVRYGYSAPDAVESDGIELPDVGQETLVSVGRLVPQKGHEYLIRAFAAICNRFPASRLIIVGEGELRPHLTALARELGVEERLSLPGYRRDALGIIRRGALYVHPSLWEGFGLVLLEAMAEGKAVVATSVSAIPEIVRHGETGLLVPPRDVDALAAALSQLLRDSRLRCRFGEAGRVRARTDFSVEAMVSRTERIYEDCISRLATPGG